MTRIEEVPHLRSVFRQLRGNVPEQLKVVQRIREVAVHQDAMDLIGLCDRALEDDDLPDYLRNWILDAYGMLDSAAVDRDKRNRLAQATKARKPRGKGDDGRTMGELIQGLARNHSGDKPSEVWPHLQSEIEKWFGNCTESKIGKTVSYRYPFADGEKTISYKQFSERLRKYKNTD
jgi:hypothetical protein